MDLNNILDRDFSGSMTDDLFEILYKIAVHPTKYKAVVNMVIDFSKNNELNMDDTKSIEKHFMTLKIYEKEINIPIEKLTEGRNIHFFESLLSNIYFQDDEKIRFLQTLKKNNFWDSFSKLCEISTTVFLQDNIDKPNSYRLINVLNDKNIANSLLQKSHYINEVANYLKYCSVKEKIDSKEEDLLLLKIKQLVKNKDNLTPYSIAINTSFLRLNQDWIKNTSKEFQKKLEEYILEIVNVKGFSKNEKKEILSNLYKHIEISKLSNVNFVLKERFIPSINMKNIKFANKVFKNIERGRTIRVLNELDSFSKEYNTTLPNKDNGYHSLVSSNHSAILEIEHDLIDILKQNNDPIIETKTKDLDFIYLRKDFDLDFFKKQLHELWRDFEVLNNLDDEIQIKKNKKLMHFYQLSFQNIYLMKELFKKNRDFYIEFKKSHKSFCNTDFFKPNQMKMTVDSFILCTQFNVNNFLKMDNDFKKDYLKHIADVLTVSIKWSTRYIVNILKILEKEPELGEVFNDLKLSTQAAKSDNNYSKLIQTFQATTQLGFIINDDLDHNISLDIDEEIQLPKQQEKIYEINMPQLY